MTLTKEEIIEALNERHSPEKQQLLSEGHVAIAGLDQMWHLHWQGSGWGICI